MERNLDNPDVLRQWIQAMEHQRDELELQIRTARIRLYGKTGSVLDLYEGQ